MKFHGIIKVLGSRYFKTPIEVSGLLNQFCPLSNDQRTEQGELWFGGKES